MMRMRSISVAALAVFLSCILGGAAIGAPAPGNTPPSQVAQPRSACGGPQRTASGLYVPRGLDGEVVTIAMTDGYKLAGDFIRRMKPATTTPGLIFLHEAGSGRRVWNPIAVQMAGRGYSVLTVDLRGHGENPTMIGNPPTSSTELTPEQWAGMVEDVHNIVSFMAMRGDVDAGNVAIVGSGFGATLALKAAAEPWGEAIRCVITINPKVEARGVKLDSGLAAIGRKRPVYIATTSSGTTAWMEAKAVAALLPAVKVFQESPLLAAAPNAMCASVFRSIPAWLIESLPPISNRPGRAKIVTPRAADRR